MMNKLFSLFFSLVCFYTTCFSMENDIKDTLTTQTFMPEGTYYTATVPDTLDLALRAELAVKGLTNFLNRNKNYGCYGHGFFNCQPPYMTTVFGGEPNWGKIAESLFMMRLISGSRENLDIQEKSIEGMIDYVQENGGTPTARVMMSLMTFHQLQPDPSLKALIERLENSFHAQAKYEGEMAWYYEIYKPEYTKLGAINWGWTVFIQGTAMRALTYYHNRFDGDDTLKLLNQLSNFIVKPKYWQAEAQPKAVVSSEHAHFSGHHHSYAAGLLGIMWYAEHTHNLRLMQFVRDGYEYIRNFGLSRIGLFGEMCTTGDMTLLAIRLSRAGVGDYWEDVDRYVRNQLVDRQITDTEKLQRAVDAKPHLTRVYPDHDEIQRPADDMTPHRPIDPLEDTEDDVVRRCAGVWLSDAAHPAYIPKHRLMWVICCSGNCPPAVYYAWESIVQCQKGNAVINLLLNRASRWLDIDSYLPFEGKVVIRNKQAKSLSVRIPLWVDKSKLRVDKNGVAWDYTYIGNYVLLKTIQPEDVITLSFPMVETTETYTLKWKHDDFWKESTDPGPDWQSPNPEKITLHLRGNTVVDISPRRAGEPYPCFERDHLKKNEAPMIKVTRFVPRQELIW